MNMDFTKDFFTNQTLKSSIPADVKCLAVADFFIEDLIGGAELTTEAILGKATKKVVKIKAKEITPELIKQNSDKYWVIFNFASLSSIAMQTFCQLPNISYSIVEYDFKYCIYRSAFGHFMQTGTACDCHLTSHGEVIKTFYMKADRLFWMAEKQKEQYLSLFPVMNVPNKHVVLTSVFTEETLSKLTMLRKVMKSSEDKKNKVWLVQNSTSWIKGSNETMTWCQMKGINAKLVGNMSYQQFLIELAKSYGLVFRPLDFDTCPRVVIEAKLLGCELLLNKNVLHKDEEWFNGSIEECEAYLCTRAQHFWDILNPLIKS